jgi:hypothetical protein
MLMLAESFFSNLDKAVVFWLVGGTVAVVWIVFASISSVLSVRAREQTRREIAAYVAEGSIDKETAVAMLTAGDDEEEKA